MINLLIWQLLTRHTELITLQNLQGQSMKKREPGQRILDTHGGSMSHAIAAHKLGFDLTIIEKDPVYYEQVKKRLIEFQRQQVLF